MFGPNHADASFPAMLTRVSRSFRREFPGLSDASFPVIFTQLSNTVTSQVSIEKNIKIAMLRDIHMTFYSTHNSVAVMHFR